MQHKRIGKGNTHPGNVRKKNEDTIVIHDDEIGILHNVYIVADGMGGHKSGEVASQSAAANIMNFLNGAVGNGEAISQNLLRDAVSFANSMVFNMASTEKKHRGMGTTVSICSRDDNNMYYAHVGDGRIYVLRNGVLKQVSEDHTLVNELLRHGSITDAEAQNHPKRNIITRAVGTERTVEIDCGYLPMKDNEIILICSDGLNDMIEDKKIWEILTSNKHSGVEESIEIKQKCVDELIAAAIEAGGKDNISVILI